MMTIEQKTPVAESGEIGMERTGKVGRELTVPNARASWRGSSRYGNTGPDVQ
jgi:hypothetical protein